MAFVESPAMWLAGYIADLPTPFDENNEIDLVAFAKLCERQIKAGVTAIVVRETAGEAASLTLTEHDAIVRAAVGIARGRIRVIAGAGSNSTGQAVELTRRAEAAGADAVLSVAPYYNKPTQSGICAHFQAIAATTTLLSSCTTFHRGRPEGCRTIRSRNWRNPGNSPDSRTPHAMSRVQGA
jgi:4-hydroxy-tetrahydrodipicolinate synthase